MNRADRRKAGRTERVKTYVLTAEQLERERRDAICGAALELLAIPCLALHDKFGFGKIRLTRFMDCAMNWYEMAMDGEVTVETMKRTLEEETGVRFLP